jgi:hypothetical protein
MATLVAAIALVDCKFAGTGKHVDVDVGGVLQHELECRGQLESVDNVSE